MKDPVEYYTSRDLVSYRFLSVTDTEVVCDQETFDRLHDYSDSLPNGRCDGKVWKRHTKDGWVLGEYVDEGDPYLIAIRWRKLVVHIEGVSS